MKLKYLVTGTGRSGTVYMARLLTSLGIPCSHEMIFDYRGFGDSEGERGRLVPAEQVVDIRNAVVITRS